MADRKRVLRTSEVLDLLADDDSGSELEVENDSMSFREIYKRFNNFVVDNMWHIPSANFSEKNFWTFSNKFQQKNYQRQKFLDKNALYTNLKIRVQAF